MCFNFLVFSSVNRWLFFLRMINDKWLRGKWKVALLEEGLPEGYNVKRVPAPVINYIQASSDPKFIRSIWFLDQTPRIVRVVAVRVSSHIVSSFESCHKLQRIRRRNSGGLLLFNATSWATLGSTHFGCRQFYVVKQHAFWERATKQGCEANWLPSQDNIHFTFFGFSSVSTALSPSSLTFG